MPYDHRTVEPKWQARWREAGLHKTPDRPRPSRSSTRSTCSPTRPAPGLHVGHCEGYTATDIITRWKRMQGFRVLHPMGWDAFGLPAENYAIKHGVHPRVTTAAGDRQLPPPDRRGRLRLRLGARGRHHRPGLRPVDAVDLPQALRARPRLRGRRPDQLVPVVQDRPRQRRGQPGALRALRHASSSARTCASGCCASPRYADRLLADLDELDWPDVDAGDAAQLDRPQRGRRGRVHDARRRSPGARSASSRPAPTRSTARRTWCCRPSTRWSTS